jgi:hypothetical protein
MPQRDPGVYVEYEHYAAAAVRFTSGFSLERYLADENPKLVLSRLLALADVHFWR